MSTQWFKFYGGEYLSDPKIERLSPLERSCWVTLLCLASMNGAGTIEFLTVETLLNKSGIQFDPYHPEEWEKALSVLKKLSGMRMIQASEEGTIKILNWKKRQETALTNAERQARFRERNGKVTEPVTEVTLEESVTTSVTQEENRIEENISDVGTSQGLSSEEEFKTIPVDDNGDQITPRFPRRKPDDNAVLIREEIEKKMGRQFVHKPAENGEIRKMLNAGYTKTEIIEEWEYQSKSPYWKDKRGGLNMADVARQIHKEHD